MSGIAEIVLSATLEPLIKQLGSAAFKFLNKTGSLNLIDEVLEDAEEKQYTENSVKQWLATLGDAAYDLEDLLDEIKIQAEMEKRSRRKEVYKIFHTPCTLIINYKLMSKMHDITRRFQDIGKEASDLKLTSGRSGGSGYGNRKDVTSVLKSHLLEDEFVVGRDEKKKEIIDMVCGSKDDLLVLPIVGMEGIGKTTLAKAVYYDPKVQENFDVMAMACVSTEFNKLEVTRKIYRDVMNREPESNDLDTLQRELETELVNKKFLIVLDDVWKVQEWDNLICSFIKGQPGSIIMITTHKEEIAIMVNPHFKPLKLELLNEEDCLSLMLHHAQISFNDKPEFKDVGMELMRRCKGLPLAARALGDILVFKREVEEWEKVLDNKIWKSEGENIMRVLRLSYFDLPPHLKRMFAYCSIFPQDYIFDKKQLVLLWMGEGFLDQHPNTQTKEEWGHQCFDELVKKSFFQYSNEESFWMLHPNSNLYLQAACNYEYFDELVRKSFFQYSSLDETMETYVMHDLVNDLAHLIAAETCDHWNGETALEKVRHCSILTQEYEIFSKFKDFPQAKRLRTLLFLVQGHNCFMSNKILPDLLPKLQHIRVLSLRHCEFTELPDSICDLTHLRYLDLSGSHIRTLPDSLDRLIWLESLSISGCYKISCLPKTLGNLCYLRHLDTSYIPILCIPSEIGKLKHLRTLGRVVLSKEGGFGLKELRNLEFLGGSLTIAGLQNVISIEGVEECLKLKKNLHELILEWNDWESEFISAEDVLECLHPPKDLKKLEITCFRGSRFPSWVGDHSYSVLSDLILIGCSNCLYLPPLGQLSNLKKLMISGMDNNACIGDEFCGHGGTNIAFSKLESLILWCCSVVVLQSFHALNSLTYFKAYRISGLCYLPRELIQSFSSLEKLEVECCDQLELLWPKETTLEHLTHLKTIRITRCPVLVSLPSHISSSMVTLQHLNLDGCPLLVSLPNDLSHLNSCTELYIAGCDKLVKFPKNRIPPCLKMLELRSCNNLRSLPSNITHLERLSIQQCKSLWGPLEVNYPSFFQQHCGFQNLQDLCVAGCYTIVNLQFLPPNLTRLTISSCRVLRSLPTHFPLSMESLSIRTCNLLDNFPSFVFPPNLSRLQVRHSKELKPLNEWGLGSLRYLKSFEIAGGFPELQQLSNDGDTCLFPNSLNELMIEEFPMLVSLGNALENLKSLQRLTISKCEKFGKLPREGVLHNLHSIKIIDCPSLRIKHHKDIADYLKNKVGIPEVIHDHFPSD